MTYDLRPDGRLWACTPTRNIGLVRNQSCGIAHTRVDSMHDSPAHSTTDGALGESVTHLTFALDHAVNENACDCWQHDKSFEPKEFLELVWSEETEDEVDEPEQDKGKHSLSRDSGRLRDMVRDVIVQVSKDGPEHVAHMTRA